MTETIRVERTFTHPVSAVWQALTDPELHAKWWAAGDVRPIVGHRFTLDMGKWGQQPCEVIEVDLEKRLRYRFSTDSLKTTLTWELTASFSLRLPSTNADHLSPVPVGDGLLLDR